MYLKFKGEEEEWGVSLIGNKGFFFPHVVPLLEEKCLAGSNPGLSPRESQRYARLAGNVDFPQEQHPGSLPYWWLAVILRSL